MYNIYQSGHLIKKYLAFRNQPHIFTFQELQPLDPWPDVLVTAEEGPICPQYDEVYGRLARPVGMSEACILANVHVPLGFSDDGPKAKCKGLPILVFVHGGGFQIGSGDSDVHGPEYLVSKGVIVITFNYRLVEL